MVRSLPFVGLLAVTLFSWVAAIVLLTVAIATGGDIGQMWLCASGGVLVAWFKLVVVDV